MQPTVGRVVHYVSYGTPGGEHPKACRAAVITQALPDDDRHEKTVGLCVLNPTGQFFHPEIHYDRGDEVDYGERPTDLCGGLDYRGGTWHWPARVESRPVDGL